MRKLLNSAALASVILGCSLVRGQEPPAATSPSEEHTWLTKFVGQWDLESEAMAGPQQPPIKCQATLSCRMLGDLWVVNEMKVDTPEMQIHSIQTLGYDPAKSKYIGTWVDSTSNLLWNYEGSVDPTGRVLTLEADGPNFMADGKTTKFRDSYEFTSANSLTIKSSMQTEEGNWITFANGTAKRKSP